MALRAPAALVEHAVLVEEGGEAGRQRDAVFGALAAQALRGKAVRASHLHPQVARASAAVIARPVGAALRHENEVIMTRILRGQACGVRSATAAFPAMYTCDRCHSVAQSGQKPWW